MIGGIIGDGIAKAGGDIPLKQDIHITDLSQGGKAATARMVTSC